MLTDRQTDRQTHTHHKTLFPDEVKIQQPQCYPRVTAYGCDWSTNANNSWVVWVINVSLHQDQFGYQLFNNITTSVFYFTL